MHRHRAGARRRPGRACLRLGAVALAACLLLGIGVGTAAAHVTVNPPTATAGSYAKLTFRVPTESAAASTIALTVSLPTEHPFPSVSVMQVPGWTAAVTKTPLDPPITQGRFTLTEAVSKVTWTADEGGGIRPGEFAEFAIMLGPVPEVSAVVLPATQAYSDGSVVAWDEVAEGGAGEREHPAPTVTITPAGADQPGSAASGTATDGIARVVGVAALVLAALALLIAVIGARRRTGAAPGGSDLTAPTNAPAREGGRKN